MLIYNERPDVSRYTLENHKRLLDIPLPEMNRNFRRYSMGFHYAYFTLNKDKGVIDHEYVKHILFETLKVTGHSFNPEGTEKHYLRSEYFYHKYHKAKILKEYLSVYPEKINEEYAEYEKKVREWIYLIHSAVRVEGYFFAPLMNKEEGLRLSQELLDIYQK